MSFAESKCYCQTYNIRCSKSPNLNVFHLTLQLSLPKLLKLGVKLKWWCGWSSTNRRWILQLHLHDEQFYCLRCVLYSRFDGICILQLSLSLNSLRPSDGIRWHKSLSILAQVMACCLTSPTHYLNHHWFIISKIQWHSSEGNFTRDTSAINHFYYLENYLSNISFKSLKAMSEKYNIESRGFITDPIIWRVDCTFHWSGEDMVCLERWVTT